MQHQHIPRRKISDGFRHLRCRNRMVRLSKQQNAVFSTGIDLNHRAALRAVAMTEILRLHAILLQQLCKQFTAQPHHASVLNCCASSGQRQRLIQSLSTGMHRLAERSQRLPGLQKVRHLINMIQIQ